MDVRVTVPDGGAHRADQVRSAELDAGFRQAGVRVLLIGTASHHRGSQLPPVPAAETTVQDLEERFRILTGGTPGSVTALVDLGRASQMAQAIETAAREADQLLLLYYVGHGVLDSRGLLYLATTETVRVGDGVRHSGLEYSYVADVIRNCRARHRIVILDCCYAGRATEEPGTTELTSDRLATASLPGTFTLTSVSRHQLASSPLGQRHTAFSGELISLLRAGDPNCGPELTLLQVYQQLCERLPGQTPRSRDDNGIGMRISLGRNVAFQGGRIRATAPVPAPTYRPVSAECPYKGLAAFDVEDERWFHGRRRLTAELVRELSARVVEQPRPLVVLGASGAGKSSVLRAGLVNAVTRGDLGVAGSSQWPPVLLTPTADPVDALAEAVSHVTGTRPEEIAARLRDDPAAFNALLRPSRQALKGMTGPDYRVVLIVDQFEELFTHQSPERAEDRRRFVRALMAAAGGSDRSPTALVVLGLRADHYGSLADFPGLTDLLRDPPVMVSAMNATEIREAIELPALSAGVRVEQQLVDQLLRDLGTAGSGQRRRGAARMRMPEGAYEPGRLPLLSHALQATWLEHEKRGAWTGHDQPELNFSGYINAGGIHGALARTGDQVLHELGPDLYPTARRLLLKLVSDAPGTDPSRLRVTPEHLLADLPQPDGQTVLDAFTAARLVTHDQGSVVFVHEAIISDWPTLAGWIDEMQASRALHEAGDAIRTSIHRDAARWRDGGRADSLLLSGAELARAVAWIAEGGTAGRLIDDFLEQSLDRRGEIRSGQRRRRGWATSLIAAAVVTTLVVGGALIFADRKLTEAEHQRQAAEDGRIAAVAATLAAKADAAQLTDPVLALRMAIAAYRIDANPQTKERIFGAVAALGRQGQVVGHTKAIRTVASGVVDGTAMTGSADRNVVVWDTANPAAPERFATLAHDRPVTVAAIGGDRLFAVTADGTSTAALWTIDKVGVATRTATLSGHTGVITSAVVSVDAGTVVTTSTDKTAMVWRVETAAKPSRLGVLRGHSDVVTSVSVSGDGSRALLGSKDGTASLWDLTARPDPVKYATIAHRSPVTIARLRADGGAFLLNGPDAQVTLWDATDPRRPRQVSTIPGSRHPADYSADGNTVATTTDEGSVLIWSTSGGNRPRRVNEIKASGSVPASIGLSRSGSQVTIAYADGTAVVADTLRRLTVRRTATIGGSLVEVQRLALTDDGRTVFTGSTGGAVMKWDARYPQAQPAVLWNRESAGLGNVAVSADGTAVAAVRTGYDTAVVWVPRKDDAFRPFTMSLGIERSAARSADIDDDGSTVVVATADGFLTRWTIADGRAERSASVEADATSLSGLALSADGRSATTAGTTGVMRMWEIPEHGPPRPRHDFRAVEGAIKSFALSGDGTRILVASAQSETAVWVSTGDDPPRRTAFLTSPTSGSAPPTSLSLNHTGSLAVAGYATGQAVLWDLTDPAHPLMVSTIQAGTGSSFATAINADGTTVATSGTDGTFIVWDTSPLIHLVRQPVTEACTLAGEGLSREQWADLAPGIPFMDTC